MPEMVEANTIKPLPITPAAPLEVIIKIPITVNICAADNQH